MQTARINQTEKTQSNKALWAGRIISGLCILFLLFDSIMKIIMNHYSAEGSEQLGWPVSAVPAIGVALLACTILYIIPRTAILGAILLTGYLGGAIATMARVSEPFYFPIIFAVLVWGGIYLRDEKLRRLFPFRRED